ncbi:hypothetical protein HMPREF2659_09350 [Pseudomonas aeruginosa]|nr:hypothetical protein HMPREF2659_09350 [Pseudomonas aeruginosa]
MAQGGLSQIAALLTAHCVLPPLPGSFPKMQRARWELLHNGQKGGRLVILQTKRRAAMRR